MKSAKQYLARSSNQQRLDDVGQAAAKKFVDDVMAFEWTDLVPIWGEVKLCGQINELFGTDHLQKAVEEAVTMETELLIEEYHDLDRYNNLIPLGRSRNKMNSSLPKSTFKS